jgi:hypothetical protein
MVLLLVLLACLGCDSFRVREAAHRTILHLGPSLWYFLHAQESHADPEVARRCVLLARAAWPNLPEGQRQAEAAKLFPIGVRKLPWLWGIHDTQDWLREAEGSDCWPSWERWRHATALWIADCAAKGMTLQCIRAYLELLRANELRWWAEHEQ